MSKKNSKPKSTEEQAPLRNKTPLPLVHDFAVKDCSLLTMSTGRYAQNRTRMI